ncbi:hypothetical protein GCM10012287_06540 [Streptomyces daqingensis]|jgi:hypothetical protein|uniref:Uncharacterized protein n=1 Tax=Streptomyces daqingensis TaxID=1472640 RepID=A0ABQ2LUZ5_9ACTN|nr:hypothetical protein [Streptomyces daqingensis]GGO43417.1 hypothetical protein GCM10012287_06540 [Streptomyces daqingensis]
MRSTVATDRDRVRDGAGVLDEKRLSGGGTSAEALDRELRSRAKELSEEAEGPLFVGRLGYADGEEAGGPWRRRHGERTSSTQR